MSVGFVQYNSGSTHASFQAVDANQITGSLTKTVAGLSYLVAGPGMQIASGSASDQVIFTAIGGGSSGDPNPSYLVLASTASLSSERVLSVSGTSGLILTDAGPNGNASLSINNNVVATVSGTTFTGPVTGTLGLVITGGAISATGITSSAGISITQGGLNVAGSTNAIATFSLPVSASVGVRLTGTTNNGLQAPKLSGSLTRTFNDTSAFIHRPGIIITSASFGGGDEQVAFGIDNNVLATVSGTRFTGPVTSSLGLVVTGTLIVSSTFSSAQMTGSLTKTVAGLSYLVAGPGIQVVSGTAADQITITNLLSGDANPSYLVLSSTSSLSSERVLSVSGTSGLILTDAGPSSNASLAINDSIVATVSGTRFTGPVTASSGLLISSPQGATGSITKTAAGNSFIASTGQIITVASGTSTQIALDVNVPAGRIVGTTFTGTLPGALNPAEIWSIIDATGTLGYQVANFTTPKGAPLTNTNFDAAMRAAIKAAVTGAALVNGGGAVLIPAGDWTVSSDGDLDPIMWNDSSWVGSVKIRGAGQGATRLIVPSGYTGSVFSFRPANLATGYQTGGGVEDLTITCTQANAKGNCVKFESNYQFVVRNCLFTNFLGKGGRGLYNSGINTTPLIIGLHLDNVEFTTYIGLDLNSINSSYAYNIRFESCGYRSAVFSGGCGLKVFGGIVEALTSGTIPDSSHVEFIPGIGGGLGSGGRFNFVWKGGYAEDGALTGSIFRCNDYISGGVGTGVFSGLIELADWETHISTSASFLSASYASSVLRNIFSTGYPIAKVDNAVSIETYGIGEGIDDGLIMDATSRRNHIRHLNGFIGAGTAMAAPVISSSLGFRLPFYYPGLYPSSSVTPSGTLIANSFTNEMMYKRTSSTDNWAPIAERPFDIDLDLGPYLGEYWDFSRTDLIQTNGTYLPGTSVGISYVTGAFSGTVLTASVTQPVLECDVNLGGNKVVKFNKTGSTNLSFIGNSTFIVSESSGPWIIGVLSHDEEAVSSDGVWCIVSGTNAAQYDGYFTLNAAALDSAGWITTSPSLLFSNQNNMTGSNGFVQEIGHGYVQGSEQSITTWFNGELQNPGFNQAGSAGVQKVWLGSNSASGQYVTIRLAFFMILKKYPGDALINRLRQYLKERFNIGALKHQAATAKSPYLPTFKTTGAPVDMLTVYEFVEVTMNGQKCYVPVFK